MQDILMSLAICNVTDKKTVFENKIELSKSVDKTLTPIVKERQDRDRHDKKIETVDDEIEEKQGNIDKLKGDKENKILVMLGQIYKGVIIPQTLSCRNGQFYKYQCRYELGLDTVKETLLKNLHAVTENIKVEKNLDILEYVLGKWDKDKDKIKSRSRWRSDEDKEKDRKKDFKFDEITIVENTGINSETPNTSFDVMHTNGVQVCENGTVNFIYQRGEDINTQSFQTENFNMLYLKFQDNIKELAKEFIKELDNEINTRTTELEDIKLKGSHLLMSAELQKGSDDIKGY